MRGTHWLKVLAGQWLGLRRLRNASPDLSVFPEFDENLRVVMQRETQLFLETQLREDRPLVEVSDGELHLRQRTVWRSTTGYPTSMGTIFGG